MPRPALYDSALRERLLDAAAAAIAASGAAGLSLRQVASAAQTSTNAVYTLFGDRAGLIAEVAARAERSFVQAQRAALGDDDPVAELRQLGLAYRAWALAHPDLYAVMFTARGPRPEPDPATGGADDGLAPLVEVLTRIDAAGLLVTGQGGGAHPSSAPVDAALSIWAATHGFVDLERHACADTPAPQRDARFILHLDSIDRAWVRR